MHWSMSVCYSENKQHKQMRFGSKSSSVAHGLLLSHNWTTTIPVVSFPNVTSAPVMWWTGETKFKPCNLTFNNSVKINVKNKKVGNYWYVKKIGNGKASLQVQKKFKCKLI